MMARYMTALELPKCIPLIEQKIPEGFGAKDYIDTLDELYSDPTNVRIPIHIGLQATMLRMRGGTPQEYEKFLSASRRHGQ